MAKVSLNKTIEATKLNKRSGFPESGPDVTISFGALVEHLSSDRDFEKFSYLGEPYRCKHDLWVSATTGGGETTRAAASAAKADAPAAPEAPKLVWEHLPSNRYSMTRTKVPGGWLVAIEGASLTFYPDPSHEWDGTSLT